VFGKLMKRSAHPNLLTFEVLAAVAKQSDGSLDQEKIKRIIRILRPDRDGTFGSSILENTIYSMTHLLFRKPFSLGVRKKCRCGK
jgi:hypothetical protein